MLLYKVLQKICTNTKTIHSEISICSSWAQYRPGAGKFEPENLDPSLCTHIIYAFAVIKDSKLVSFEWNDEDNEWSKGLHDSQKILFSMGNDLFQACSTVY